MNVRELKEKLRQFWEARGYDIDASTCNECYPNDDEEVKCEYAFDLYNTNGDCLASK